MKGILPAFLLLSFVFSPRIVGPFRLGDLLLIAALPVLLPRLAAWRKRPLASWQRLYLVFLTWSSIVTMLSLVTGTNGRGLDAALAIARLAEIGLLVLAASDLDAAGRRLLRRVAVASLAVLFAVALGEVLEAYLRSNDLFTRALNAGVFAGEANHLAGAAVMLAAAAPATLPLALGVVAAAGARTAMLAVLLLAARDWITTRRHRRAALFAATLALLLVAAPAAHRLRFVELPTGAAAYAGPHVDRAIAWRVAIREAPVATGVGLGARPSSVYESAYVHLYAETGLPGLELWIALLGLILVDSAKRQATGDSRGAIALGLLALGLTANVEIIARIIGPAAILFGADSSNQENCESGEKNADLA